MDFERGYILEIDYNSVYKKTRFALLLAIWVSSGSLIKYTEQIQREIVKTQTPAVYYEKK